MRLAEILSGKEKLDQRLEALDRAIALDPRHVESHDLKAQLLAEAGRFQDAAAACTPLAWGNRPPIPLRGRAAWVEARRGAVEGAISQMRAVLAEDGDYYWGWQNLADWGRDSGKPALYLEAAEVMVRLAPASPYAAGYRGDARQKSGDRSGAKIEYRRAIDKAPDYSFAGFRLFDLELEDRDLKAAGSVLEVLTLHNKGQSLWPGRCSLPRQRKTVQALWRPLPGSAQTDGSDEWPLRTADAAFTKARWARAAESTYSAALQKDSVHPLTATLWIEQLGQAAPLGASTRDGLATGQGQRRTPCSRRLPWDRGVARSHRKVRTLIRRHRQALRADTECWGTAALPFLRSSVAETSSNG